VNSERAPRRMLKAETRALEAFNGEGESRKETDDEERSPVILPVWTQPLLTSEAIPQSPRKKGKWEALVRKRRTPGTESWPRTVQLGVLAKAAEIRSRLPHTSSKKKKSWKGDDLRQMPKRKTSSGEAIAQKRKYGYLTLEGGKKRCSIEAKKERVGIGGA